MSIRLDLDVPALERLIGGDTEIEISLRRGIVEEFAKRHLIAVVKDEAFKDFLDRESKIARAALDAAFVQHIGTIKERGYTTEVVNISAAVKAAIEAEAARRFDKYIADSVERVWKEKCEPKLESWLDRLLIRHVSEAVEKRVKEHQADTVNKLVDERLAKAAVAMREAARA